MTSPTADSLGLSDLAKVGFLQQQDEAPTGHWTWLPLGTEFARVLLDITAGRLAAEGYEQIGVPALQRMESPRLRNTVDKYDDRIYHLRDGPPAALAWNTDYLCFSLLRHLRPSLPARVFAHTTFFRREQSGEVGLRRGRSFATLDAHALVRGVDAGLAEVSELLQLSLGLLGDVLPSGAWWLDVSVDADRRAELDAAVERLTTGSDLPSEVTWMETPTNYYALQVKIMGGSGPRAYQLSNLQLDLVNGPAHDLGEDSVIVHAAPVARPERFAMAAMSASDGTAKRRSWPTVLSPSQVRLLPVDDEAREKAVGFARTWRAAGLRVDVDVSPAPLPARLRRARRQWVPYIGLVGADDQLGALTVEGPDGNHTHLETVALEALAAAELVVPPRLPVCCGALTVG